MTVRTRFAPSPTGYLHIGGVRTALFNWLLARQAGGQFILRIDDTDAKRNVAEALQPIIDGFRWLGLDWDEGPSSVSDSTTGPNAPYVQTERVAHYEAALQKLIESEKIYPCTCSRSDVLAAASAPHAGQEGPIYPGTCANRSSKDAEELSDVYSWRFRTSDSTNQSASYNDLFAGPQSLNVAHDLGDFVIGKADGTIAYQPAVVVDDHAMGVTEVFRGDDLIPSTFRQLELYRHFGWQPPKFVHVPLVVGTDGRRLAKRHGDTRLSTIRSAGITAEQVIGFLAHRSGLCPSAKPISAAELLSDFDLHRVPHEPLVISTDDYRELGLLS